MTRKHASRQQDVVTRFNAYLAEEEALAVEPTGKAGRPKTARRRAMDRTAEAMGFSGYRSVETVLVRHERATAPTIETFGMELDPEFAKGILAIQATVTSALEACKLVREASESLGGLVHLDDEGGDPLEGIEEALSDNMPRILCPACKGVVPNCAYCNGDGWFDAARPGAWDPRLLDAEDIHVDSGNGAVVTLDEYEAGQK